MSRLDKFITRMMAQRALLDHACAQLSGSGSPEGHVIELGLGNGRTYQHLREKLPGRRIVAFDRTLVPHPRSYPPEGDLILGDIRETAASFGDRFGAIAALLHADLGDGTEHGDAGIRTWLPGLAHALVRPGGLILTSTDIAHAGLRLEPLPRDIPDYEYFTYRRL